MSGLGCIRQHQRQRGTADTGFIAVDRPPPISLHSRLPATRGASSSEQLLKGAEFDSLEFRFGSTAAEGHKQTKTDDCIKFMSISTRAMIVAKSTRNTKMLQFYLLLWNVRHLPAAMDSLTRNYLSLSTKDYGKRIH